CKGQIVVQPQKTELSDVGGDSDIGQIHLKDYSVAGDHPSGLTDMKDSVVQLDFAGIPQGSDVVGVRLVEADDRKADSGEDEFEGLRRHRPPVEAEDDARPDQRRLPWLIDVFLYPTSVSGLTVLGVLFFAPIILDLIAAGASMVVGPLLAGLVSLALLPFRFAVGAYLFWYIGMCIHESASGRIRAPGVLTGRYDVDLVEMGFQMLRILCCFGGCLAPAVVYYGFAGEQDMIYWAILICGVFFLPMSLLATVLFDSFAGLNPILVISSIFSTFFRYCCIAPAFYLPAFIIIVAARAMGEKASLLAALGLGVLSLYLLMVASHILGWFYYRNSKKLYWEV
ncbi:MAG: hypothetical protein KAT00_02710, partial [Planctomycetes bacterium]|nr:hypothetical protein [Planctomycetota bacterium]